MAPWGTGSSRAQEWRPVEDTLWLLTAGLPLGASCPLSIQETAALQRRTLLSKTARWGQPRGLPTGHSAPHLPAEWGTLGLGAVLTPRNLLGNRVRRRRKKQHQVRQLRERQAAGQERRGERGCADPAQPGLALRHWCVACGWMRSPVSTAYCQVLRNVRCILFCIYTYKK